MVAIVAMDGVGDSCNGCDSGDGGGGRDGDGVVFRCIGAVVIEKLLLL